MHYAITVDGYGHSTTRQTITAAAEEALALARIYRAPTRISLCSGDPARPQRPTLARVHAGPAGWAAPILEPMPALAEQQVA